MTDSGAVPVIAVRLAEGRCGSTLLMQLLATSPEIVFEDRYPAEYRYLSYFAKLATMMTEPFDEQRHVGVTPFFFGAEQQWGPIPFRSEIVDPTELTAPLLRQMWLAWSESARSRYPSMRLYAEKMAVTVDALVEAAIPVRVIDLLRDPRDVLASIRAFTATGVDGFGRTEGIDEDAYLDQFIHRFGIGLDRMQQPLPEGIDRIVVCYEDLVTDLENESDRIANWLQVSLLADTVHANVGNYARHMTSGSPTASIGRWSRDLTKAEALAIAQRLGERCSTFGYRL